MRSISYNESHMHSTFGLSLAWVAPLPLLTGDLLRMLLGDSALGLSAFFLWMGLVAFLGVTVVLTRMSFSGSPRLALGAAIICTIGIMAAACITALYRVDAALDAGLEPALRPAVDAALLGSPILIRTIFPFSPLFPLGLLVLVGLLWRTGQFGAMAALNLMIGAILFPIGRLSDSAMLQLLSDLALLVGFLTAGWRVGTAAPPVKEDGDAHQA